MRYSIGGIIILGLGVLAFAMNAATAGALEVTVSGIGENGSVYETHAYCVPTADGKAEPKGKNINPAVSWEKGPEGTQSYALIMVDTEVPQDFTHAGKEGRIVSAKMPRQLFYHWVLVDIPAEVTSLEEGAFSKDGAAPPVGRHGVNDYPKFMELTPDEETLAQYSNYDGPCPPWNDEKLHKYHYRIYALNVSTLKLPEHFSGADVFKAITGHVLAEGEAVGTYTLNQKIHF